MKFGHIYAMIIVACLVFAAQSKLLHNHQQTQDPNWAIAYAGELNATQRILETTLGDAVKKLQYIQSTINQVYPNFPKNLSLLAPAILEQASQVNQAVIAPVSLKLDGCVNLTQEQNNTITANLK